MAPRSSKLGRGREATLRLVGGEGLSIALWGVNMRVNGGHNLSGTRNRVQFVVCTNEIDPVHTARPWRRVPLMPDDESAIGVERIWRLW
jgi:hypothetical protein